MSCVGITNPKKGLPRGRSDDAIDAHVLRYLPMVTSRQTARLQRELGTHREASSRDDLREKPLLAAVARRPLLGVDESRMMIA